MAGIYWDLKSIFHQLHNKILILIQYKYKVRKLGEFSRGGASVRCSLVPLRGSCTQIGNGVQKTRVMSGGEVLCRCYRGDRCDQSRNWPPGQWEIKWKVWRIMQGKAKGKTGNMAVGKQGPWAAQRCWALFLQVFIHAHSPGVSKRP